MSEQAPFSPAVSRRNERLGIANGILFALGEGFASAGLVLALLVRELGGSLTLVGLLPALQTGGYLLPQLLLGGRIQAMPLKLPIYQRAALVRVIAWLALTIAIVSAAVLPPTTALWAIVVSFAIFNLAGGTSTLAFQDVVAKTIPARRRGSFFATRQLYGGLLTFVLVGPLVRWLLDSQSPLGFPFNYGLLSTLALFCFGFGLASFALLTEPPSAHPGPRLRVIEGLRRAPAMLQGNRSYRWFIGSRILTRAGQIAEPFYIIYAIEVLKLPASLAGVYLALRAVAGALSNLGWSRISERLGNRQVLFISGILFVLTPPLVLLCQLVSQTGQMVLIGAVFLLVGMANDGANIGGVYLMEIVPEDERPTYLGLANTALGSAAFVPVFGGWLVAVIGYQGTFIVGLVLACAGLLATLPLREADSRLAARRVT